MKKFRLFLLITAISVLLSGCRFFLPFFYLNFSGSDEAAIVETLPIVSDVDAHLDAEDIFYRAKFAASDMVYQYSQQLTFDFVEDIDGFQYSYQVQENQAITLSEADCAVNVATEFYNVEYPEETSTYQEYYRDENGSLAYYYADPDEDVYIRELIPLGDYVPYAVIVDFAVYCIPYTLEGLTLEPQTRMLNEREVYVLNYPQSALYAFGSTGNEAMDAKLHKRTISTTWYVDAETYLPVQQKFSLTPIDDLMWQIIDARYHVGSLDDGVSFTGFSFLCNYESFDPVEVEPIPADVLQKAWQNAGASAG